ncbi:MAG: hypothetical protein RIF32_09185 [Leptospirales bacterium]|jgi:hypothetical protein
MDDSDLDEWEKEAMQRAERRFPISKADLEHEFSERSQLNVRLIRGTYFSIHDNRGDTPGAENLPEKYRDSLLLIHSEKNRFRFLCDLIMASWLPELPELLRLLIALEPPADDPAFEAPEDLLWQAETFGLEVLPDCYRIGYAGGGPAPMFASKDLLLGILELIAEGLTIVGENLEFNTARLLADIRGLKKRVLVRASGEPDGGAAESDSGADPQSP